MASEVSVQGFIHKLEGRWVGKIFLLLLLAAVAGVVFMMVASKFPGLSSPDGIDQAQIAQQLANGKGFSTLMLRPAAIGQFQQNKGAVPKGNFPDTYQAPLNPWINSIALRIVKHVLPQNAKDRIAEWARGDRTIAGVSIVFFLLSVVLNYFIGKRLFDHRIGIFSACLMLVCASFWEFARSGLPQMLLLFLFSASVYAMVRAVEAYYADKSSFRWLLAATVFFGLMALAHALTIWIFLGVLVFSGLFFPNRVKNVISMLILFLIIYSPWLIRNYEVCGNIGGVAIFTLFGSAGQAQVFEMMRQNHISLQGVSPILLRSKMLVQFSDQFGNLFQLLGYSLIAPVFFLSLMHVFKRRETSMFRWCMLTMFVFGAFGMLLFGFQDSWLNHDLQPNNLYILFIPLMTMYGMAFVLVLWSRLGIDFAIFRYIFIGLIFVISGLPFVKDLFGSQSGLQFNWPPYVPPSIAMLGQWTDPNEIIVSDMPWAVAWYADRKSLLLPEKPEDLQYVTDWSLQARLGGMYLTPISRNQPLASSIMVGDYKPWRTFIIGIPDLKTDPLFHAGTAALPFKGECVFYSDRVRWPENTDLPKKKKKAE